METFHKSIKYVCITAFLIVFNNSCWDYIKHLDEIYPRKEKQIEHQKTLDQMFPVIPKEFILPQGPLIIPQDCPPNYAGVRLLIGRFI
jgi:hypothetical protein